MWDELTLDLVVGLALSCSAVVGLAMAPALGETMGTLAYWALVAYRSGRRLVGRAARR